MEIKELIQKAHENAVNKGFWEDVELKNNEFMLITRELGKDGSRISYKNINAIGNRLMLIVGELAEAQEGLRHDDIDNFLEELADVAIRLADLCGGLNINLEDAIVKKMEKNRQRPYKHGKAF